MQFGGQLTLISAVYRPQLGSIARLLKFIIITSGVSRNCWDR